MIVAIARANLLFPLNLGRCYLYIGLLTYSLLRPPSFPPKCPSLPPSLPTLHHTTAEGETCLHTELVVRFKELLRAMLQYVKTRHSHGVSWNPNGKPLTAAP